MKSGIQTVVKSFKVAKIGLEQSTAKKVSISCICKKKNGDDFLYSVSNFCRKNAANLVNILLHILLGKECENLLFLPKFLMKKFCRKSGFCHNIITHLVYLNLYFLLIFFTAVCIK